MAILAGSLALALATYLAAAECAEGGRLLGAAGVVRQRAFNDCGPSALLMVLRARGAIATDAAVRAAVPLGPRGTSMLALERAAESLGLRAAGVRTSLDTVRVVWLPAVAFVDDDHFVVLREVGPDEVVVDDPAVGRIAYTRPVFERHWRGELLVVTASSRGPFDGDEDRWPSDRRAWAHREPDRAVAHVGSVIKP